MDAVSLARAALDRQQHGMGRVASECNYIEAQVHGPIVFARDVAEIVINKEFRARSAPAGSKGMVQCRGRRARRQAARRRGHGRFFGGAAGRTLPPSGNSSAARLSLCALKSRFRSWISKNTVRSEERAFYAAHLDQARIDAKLHDVQQDDAGLQAFISQMLSIRPGGAAVSRILGTVPLVAGGDAPKRPRSLCRLCRTIPACSPEGQHTEDDVLQDAMWQAVSDVMGKGRLDSLPPLKN